MINGGTNTWEATTNWCEWAKACIINLIRKICGETTGECVRRDQHTSIADFRLNQQTSLRCSRNTAAPSADFIIFWWENNRTCLEIQRYILNINERNQIFDCSSPRQQRRICVCILFLLSFRVALQPQMDHGISSDLEELAIFAKSASIWMRLFSVKILSTPRT